MARPLRIEYEGAIYHLLSRGDRREDILAGKRSKVSTDRNLKLRNPFTRPSVPQENRPGSLLTIDSKEQLR